MKPLDTQARPGQQSESPIQGWRSRAFGLDLEAGFQVSGLPPAPESADLRRTTMELASDAALARAWRPATPTRLQDSRAPDGRLLLAIDSDNRLGYRLTSADWGEYLISADGREVKCGPLRLTKWRRDRFLTARALPLAATLSGLEVFHASAVSLGDAVIAMVGPRYMGKTSVAVNFVLRGASFMTDDLLALESRRGQILAHPGAAVMGVREAEYRLIESRQRRQLGSFVRRLDKFFTEVEREDRSLPLRILYFLDRRREIKELAIEELKRPDPRQLLASSFFNDIVQSPERLLAQLDLCAQLSHNALICRVSVPPSVGAKALAGSLAEHATARLGTRTGS